jgi:hypothetical protein
MSKHEKEGYIWVEGHYRKLPPKTSYPRHGMMFVQDKEKETRHKIRNINNRINELNELRSEIEGEL